MTLNKVESFLQGARLPLQSVALLIMMIVPLFLYTAAQAGYEEWTLALLALLGGGMALAVAAS